MSLERLLADARARTGLRYPVELRTGQYLFDDGVLQEWVHRLVCVGEDGVPQYTTGLVVRGPVRATYTEGDGR